MLPKCVLVSFEIAFEIVVAEHDIGDFAVAVGRADADQLGSVGHDSDFDLRAVQRVDRHGNTFSSMSPDRHFHLSLRNSREGHRH